MNKILVFSTVISATLMILTACNKEEASKQPYDEEVFYRPISGVKKGQTVNIKFTDGGLKSDWTVAPNDGVKIFAKEKSADILFTQPGKYTVSAKATTTGQVFTDTVHVVDSPYIPTVYPSAMDLAADDTITLEPLSFRDDVLVFYARSKKSYSCWAELLYHNNSTSTAVKIDFTGVPSPVAIQCTPGPYPAPSSSVYMHGYGNGTHDIAIRIGSSLTTYTGTLTVTDDKYVFNWPDDIRVVIAPKEIARVK